MAATAGGQESGFVAAESAAAKPEAQLLQFSFAGSPWRDVIQWLADEGGLALHVGDLPPGSFTYSDPNPYTHQRAIDRVNLFLLPQGFTVVRSGHLLSVINLGDPRSMQQLDALAELVTIDQLPARDNHDVVKCFFPLGELEPEEAVQELSALNLMTKPAVFEKTKQLLITDTAGKLKNVKSVLDSFVPSVMDNGTVVKSFTLQHVQAEDVLVVARPHLGLATDEMIGIDVSLSADVQGKNIFVTGVEDKVKLIEGLVSAIDQPKQSMSTEDGDMELKAYPVDSGNVETVYNVLQTLLAGKQVRLSTDEAAGSVVALASPSVQREIEQTVLQLQANDAEFEVIPLKTVDPYLAISLLEEMLDLPDALDDPEDIDRRAPKIDADPANMRLFVRAKKPQIEQIKKIVAGLDISTNIGSDDEIRIFPLKGKQAEQVLTTAAKFWRANPIILFRGGETCEPDETERVPGGEAPTTELQSVQRLQPVQPLALAVRNELMLTSSTANSKAAAIRCQITARGLLMQSEDTRALDQFEEHLRAIAGPLDSLPSPPIVFYLKYTKAADAIRMLAELLDGGEAAGFAESGSLVNGYVSSSDSFLGSLVTSRDGTITMTSGSITVVADSRLNRLITQGSASDIDRIEQYLKIVDKDNSITAIETYGTSRVIELLHTKASEVAAAIRDAYAGRVTAASTQPNQPGGSPQDSQAQQAAAAKAAAKQADSKKSQSQKNASQPPRDLEPKMTIAVHEPSNSLIVTAPEQLLSEVEKLAMSIDERGRQTIEVIAPLNGELIESVLQEVLLGTRSSGSERGSSSQSSRPAPSVPSSTSRTKSSR